MEVIARVFRISFRCPILTGAGYLFALTTAICALLMPLLFGMGIDLMVERDPKTGEFVRGETPLSVIALIGCGIAGLGLLRGLSLLGRNYATNKLTRVASFHYMNELYDKLQNLSFGFHDHELSGELMSRSIPDVEATFQISRVNPIATVEGLLRFTATLAIMYLLNWPIALACSLLIPLIALRSAFVIPRLRRLWSRSHEEQGRLSALFTESMHRIPLAKASGSEEYEKAKFRRQADETRAAYIRAMDLQRSNRATMTLFLTAGMGLILWWGAWQVVAGAMTIGEMTTIILLLGLMVSPAQVLARSVGIYARGVAAGRRVFAILDAASPVVEHPDAKDVERLEGKIVFQDVSFAYGTSHLALHGVSFETAPGQTVAIVGPTGSGKSTLVNLLPRFYDVAPGNGSISIDGHDIRQLTLKSLRRNVGVVHQNTHLFEGTVRDNIAYSRPEATSAEVKGMARLAQIHDEIAAFPEGYDTWVGEGGITLSGGQKQRISIARTMLMDPPIIVMDDSTSSVDVKTEQRVHHAMNTLAQGRTTLVIAHRLSTVKNADLILVMSAGEVVERGTHQALMQHAGHYREIYQKQLAP